MNRVTVIPLVVLAGILLVVTCTINLLITGNFKVVMNPKHPIAIVIKDYERLYSN